MCPFSFLRSSLLRTTDTWANTGLLQDYIRSCITNNLTDNNVSSNEVIKCCVITITHRKKCMSQISSGLSYWDQHFPRGFQTTLEHTVPWFNTNPVVELSPVINQVSLWCCYIACIWHYRQGEMAFRWGLGVNRMFSPDKIVYLSLCPLSVGTGWFWGLWASVEEMCFECIVVNIDVTHMQDNYKMYIFFFFFATHPPLPVLDDDPGESLFSGGMTQILQRLFGRKHPPCCCWPSDQFLRERFHATLFTR